MAKAAQMQDFFSYLRFASISADPSCAPEMARCAEWLRKKLARLGFNARLFSSGGPPVVLARRDARHPHAPTLLIYGHYDVQPVGPPDAWLNPPFSPVVREGLVYARGATDNKGQTLAHVLGTEAWLFEEHELPVNLIYLVEGEEEVGSPHLARFLNDNAGMLACDGILVSDTSMVERGHPAITCGLRGIVCINLKLTGPREDLHSGVFGGAVANPATELARLIAAMHDPSGHIAIPGFYDQVATADPIETAAWREIADSEGQVLRATGSPCLQGEADYTTLERTWIRPTAEVNGITAGYQGPGTKTIIPLEASAKLSFRLVPDQVPAEIAEKVIEFFRKSASPGVTLQATYDHGGAPYFFEPNSPLAVAVKESLREVFGRPPTLVREGLSIPVLSLFREALGRDTLLVGFGLPDCSAHGPNESFPIEQLDRGIAFHVALLRGYASRSATQSA